MYIHFIALKPSTKNMLSLKCSNKETTVDDNSTGLRWINSDNYNRFKTKMKNIEAKTEIT